MHRFQMTVRIQGSNRLLRWFFLEGILSFLISFSLPARASDTLRILPLGDSITEGYYGPGGYRSPLYDRLAAGGYAVQFVGSMNSLPSPQLIASGNDHHEGHSGFVIQKGPGTSDGLDDHIATWLGAYGPSPDLILLMIGTNDAGQNYDMPHAPERLSRFISRILDRTNGLRRDAFMIVATIPPFGNNAAAETIGQAYNAALPGVVAQHQARGESVVCVDMHGALTTADLVDGVHPHPVGFEKMAATWFGKLAQVVDPDGALANHQQAPVLLSATHGGNRTHIDLHFNKPVAQDLITPAHFSVNDGVTVISAVLDSGTLRDVHLTTSTQELQHQYTVKALAMKDRSVLTNRPSADSSATFQSAEAAGGNGPVPQVSESEGYTLIYDLDIPITGSFNGAGAPYTVDLSESFRNDFTRIAYYLELQPANGPKQWVWVSMNAFTRDVRKIGVPTRSRGAVFQIPVQSMNVFSSESSVTSGTGLAGGNIEFWPSSYGPFNMLLVTNGLPAYDWGDTVGDLSNGYGSMQVHNHDAMQVLFAYNHWGDAGGAAADIGIGNQPPTSLPPAAQGEAEPDWTFAGNAGNYTSRRLQVYVLPVPFGVSEILPSGSRTGFYIKFSRPMQISDLQDARNYSIDGGLPVRYAAPNPNNPAVVFLKTDPIEGGKTYTIRFANLKDAEGNSLPSTATAVFSDALPADPIFMRVNESTNFSVLYDLNIPLASSFNFYNIPYTVDRTGFLFGSIRRVGYHLELNSAAQGLQWIFVSVDPFASDLAGLGVPSGFANGPVYFQQPVANMNVYSSVSGIVTGNGIQSGNIEFWSSDYDGANTASVPNADGIVLDWGDNHGQGNGYGSMQIHNHDAKQVLFAYNHWGNSTLQNVAGQVQTPVDIGIGNSPAGETDWTFEATSTLYSSRRLQVLVQMDDPPEPPPPPQPPTLTIHLDGGDVVVEWPDTGFQLQQNDDLNNPLGWILYPGEIGYSSLGDRQARIPADAAPLFFRLGL